MTVVDEVLFHLGSLLGIGLNSTLSIILILGGVWIAYEFVNKVAKIAKKLLK